MADCWRSYSDEWSLFIKGRARVTVFGAEGNARTFNYVPGDIGIVPKNMGHFVENIGDEPIEMLEVFRADEFVSFAFPNPALRICRNEVTDVSCGSCRETSLSFSGWETRPSARWWTPCSRMMKRPGRSSSKRSRGSRKMSPCRLSLRSLLGRLMMSCELRLMLRE